jgi:hypothetical protein
VGLFGVSHFLDHGFHPVVQSPPSIVHKISHAISKTSGVNVYASAKLAAVLGLVGSPDAFFGVIVPQALSASVGFRDQENTAIEWLETITATR